MRSTNSARGCGRVIEFRSTKPSLAENVFIAPGAAVIGDVTIGSQSSVWFNAVIRGDVGPIRIGDRSNIQDGAVVHLSTKQDPTIIGSDVLIGHGAIIHGCTIADWGFVGMGSIALDGSHIESYGMLAAGAMLTAGNVIGERQLWAGRPAKFLRDLTDHDVEMIRWGVKRYIDNARQYLTEALASAGISHLS
jgi:gamma-carbonic anhydrase